MESSTNGLGTIHNSGIARVFHRTMDSKATGRKYIHRRTAGAVGIDTGNQLSLESGDVILSINGQAIGTLDEFWNAVKGSPRTMELVVRDSRHPHPNRRFRVELRY